MMSYEMEFHTVTMLDFWISPKLQKATKISEKVVKTNRKNIKKI